MVLSKILKALEDFLDDLVKSSKTFSGKDKIEEFLKKQDDIISIVNKALGIDEWVSIAEQAEEHHGQLNGEYGTAESKYKAWETAKGLYEDTVKVIAGYEASLQTAKDENNAEDIEEYEELIERATTSLKRRKELMDKAWDKFAKAATDAASTAVTLFAEHLQLQNGMD